MALALIPRPPQSCIPRPQDIDGPPNQWHVILGAVSSPTAQRGDWKTYPHMQSKESWKATMGVRAAEFHTFLELHSVWLSECAVCARVGRGMRADFGGHVGAPFHFKDLGRLLTDGMPIEDLRNGLWQETMVQGGAVRFNHADGVVEICKGTPPIGVGAASSAVAAIVAVPSGPCDLAAAVPSDGDLPCVEVMPEENIWFTVCEYLGQPTAKDGDARSCPFFHSRNAWKLAVQTLAPRVGKLLQRYNVWPECCICDRMLGWDEHLPAAKHYDKLMERLPAGVPLISLAPEFWQYWDVAFPGGRGCIRFNHVHGRCDILRGAPLDRTDKNIEVKKFPSQVGALPPFGALPTAAWPAAAPPLGGAAPPPMGMMLAPCDAGPSRPHQLRAPLTPDSVKELPEEGLWFQVFPPVGFPTQLGGDHRCYPHLSSKSAWKVAFTPPTRAVEDFLGKLSPPIYPECMICPRSRGFGEHLPAEKHLKTLWEAHLRDNVPVEVARQHLWHSWNFQGGAIRINYADGVVELCRGPLRDAQVVGAPAGWPAAMAAQTSPAVAPGPGAQGSWAGFMPSTAQPPPPASPPPLQSQPPPPQQSPQPQQQPPPQQPQQTQLQPVPQNGRQPPSAQLLNAAGLCVWLWRHVFSGAARDAEAGLNRVGVPMEGRSCVVCDGAEQLLTFDHLMSATHLQKLTMKLALTAKDVTKRQVEGEIIQRWEVNGYRVKLDHVPLRLEVLSPGQDQEARREHPPQHSPQSQSSWEHGLAPAAVPSVAAACAPVSGPTAPPYPPATFPAASAPGVVAVAAMPRPPQSAVADEAAGCAGTMWNGAAAPATCTSAAVAADGPWRREVEYSGRARWVGPGDSFYEDEAEACGWQIFTWSDRKYYHSEASKTWFWTDTGTGGQ